RLLTTMGKVYTGLGLYGRSTDLLTESLDARGSSAANDVTTAIALADALYLKGDYEAAERRYQGVSDALRRQPWDADRSDAANGLADVLTQNADYARAIALYREAFQSDVRTWGVVDVHSARTSNGLGLALMYSGDPAGAEPSLRVALEGYRTSLGADHW